MPQVKSCEPYRIAFHVAASGLAMVSTRGALLDVNRAFGQILGYGSESELVGKSFREIVHPDDVDDAVAALDGLLDGTRQRYQAERRYQRRDGTEVLVLVGVALVRDARHRPWYFIAQVQDLTARQERDVLARRTALVQNHRYTAQAFESDLLTPLRALRDELAHPDAARAAQTAQDTLDRAERLHRALLDEEWGIANPR